MPRITRGLVDGYAYHIFNRGNGKQVVFHKPQDYKVFIELMREARDRHAIKLFGYCLMPNHFHILVMAIRAEELIKCMQWLMTSHVRRHHSHYKTSGHVWQGRYKSFVIQTDNHLLTVLRYVLRNPARAGLVKLAKNWKWSSCCAESINKTIPLLVDELSVKLPKDWVENYLDRPLTEGELGKLQTSINRGAPYGEIGWQKKISKELNLESTLMPRGRPKKAQRVKSSLSPF